jgi:hypothetical protein
LSFGEKGSVVFKKNAANLSKTGIAKIATLRIGTRRLDLQGSGDLQIYAKSGKWFSLSGI